MLKTLQGHQTPFQGKMEVYKINCNCKIINASIVEGGSTAGIIVGGDNDQAESHSPCRYP